jgi:hypothetical protein
MAIICIFSLTTIRVPAGTKTDGRTLWTGKYLWQEQFSRGGCVVLFDLIFLPFVSNYTTYIHGIRGKFFYETTEKSSLCV